MIVASATNDKDTIIKNHFGDAEYFSIYEVSEKAIKYIDVICNTKRLEEGSHSEKAMNILALLEEKKVDVLVNRAFGVNLKIMDKYLLPIIIRKSSIIEALNIIQANFKEILHVITNNKSCYMLISTENEVKVIETK